MSDSGVYAAMASSEPHLVLNVGDMHYAGMSGATSRFFQQAYHEVFKSREMRALYENYPLAYTFDDHDTGENNSNGLKSSTA